MKKLYPIIIIALMLMLLNISVSADSIVEGNSEWNNQMQELVNSFQELRSCQLPRHLMNENAQRRASDFNVSSYFDVLDRLSIEDGYVLDYVYCYDGMGGSPLLYARHEDNEPYSTYDEYLSSATDDQSNWISHVITDETEEGYFQYILLYCFGSQFYLFWHSNFFDTQFVCSKERINSILYPEDGFGMGFTEDQITASQEINPSPQIDISDNDVTLRVITFSKWGGFSEVIFTMSNSFPNAVTDSQRRNLVPYDCGIVY